MADVKAHCATAVVTVAGLSGVVLTWFLSTIQHLAACAIDRVVDLCRWQTVFDVGPPLSVDAALTTVVGTVACVLLASVLTVWIIGHGSSGGTRLLDFAVVAIPCLVITAVTAGPAMAFAVVDSMPVPGDRRYGEGLLAGFSLLFGVGLALLVGTGVATATAMLHAPPRGPGASRQLPSVLLFVAALSAPVLITVYWIESGPPDLAFVDSRRPAETGIWFGILVAASLGTASVVAALLRRRDILAGLLTMSLVFLASAVAVPVLHLILASWQPYALSDTPATWTFFVHFAFLAVAMPVFAVAPPILLGAAHSVIMARYWVSTSIVEEDAP